MKMILACILCWIIASSCSFAGETEYVALGKVMMNCSPDAGAVSPEFVGTQRELLEGGELRRRALERVRSLHPEFKEIDVEIKTTNTKNSWMVSVAAVGAEPKYTRVFLNALLDEYIAFRKELIEKSLGSAMNKVIEEVLAREKAVKQKSAALEEFAKRDDIEVLEALRDRARKKIVEEPDEKKVEEAVLKMKEIGVKLSAYKSLRNDFEKANENYREWVATLNRMDSNGVVFSDKVAIIERPVIAVEQVPALGSGDMLVEIIRAIVGAMRW